MTNESTLQINMDTDVLKKAEKLYSNMGTSLVDILKQFTIKSVEANGIPHTISTPANKDCQRLGVAKGKFKTPTDIDLYNDEIEQLFYGGDE